MKKKSAKTKTKAKAAPKSDTAGVNAYLAKAKPDQRAALQRLRKQIQQACPEAVEVNSYGIAGFKYKGRPLLYLGFAKEHVALYGSVLKDFEKELKGFKIFKGTIRFTPEKPIPASVVKKIVKYRMAAIDKKAKVKK